MSHVMTGHSDDASLAIACPADPFLPWLWKEPYHVLYGRYILRERISGWALSLLIAPLALFGLWVYVGCSSDEQSRNSAMS